MKDLNNDLIARLVGYRRNLNESNEQTLAPKREPGVFGDLSAAGKGNLPLRPTNNSGDNALEAPVDEDMMPAAVSPEMLEKLHGLLNKIGVDDSDIALNSVMLKPSGCVKVAKALTGSPMDEGKAVEFVKDAISKLAQHLVGEDAVQEDELNEFQEFSHDDRFSYVTDAVGDVTVFDAVDGTGIHLRGSDAMELLGDLNMYGKTPEQVQEILAKYQHVMETGEEGEVAEDVSNSKIFGSQGLPEMLGDLMSDVHSMQDKLASMAGSAQQNGDPQALFAAKVFIGELQNLEDAINDYMRKISD
jgi:hypothetical protein